MKILDDLSVEFGASTSTLERIVLSAPIRYKSFKIDKRNSKKKRIIAQPDRAVKALQRYVLSTRLSKFDVSDIAMAYVRDRGIFENAKMHVDSEYILKLDFSNFFHSILPSDFAHFVRVQKIHCY
ncbi:hypothetical protein C8024_02115 [Sphingopyxis sp. BSNA05]|nr:hypothetical protein [Sphingopyxis sp. BSNA05]